MEEEIDFLEKIISQQSKLGESRKRLPEFVKKACSEEKLLCPPMLSEREPKGGGELSIHRETAFPDAVRVRGEAASP